ncbi:MAG: hypothetical protein EXR72_24535 [Myxococcales bacterium]|nr:hypothetical protein [Myxococcales bacterium]
MRPALLACLTGTLLVSGCGPIQFVTAVPFEAVGAIGEAKHLDAEKYAPYEMTAAGEYVHKSRELAGHARYQTSVEFARKATKHARDAKKIAMEKGEGPADRGGERSDGDKSRPPAAGPKK